MRQNLDMRVVTHGVDRLTYRELHGVKLREASARSVQVIDALLYVVGVRGGVRFEGRWYPLDVSDLLARLGEG
jgi:hypothetical protein